MQFESPSTGNIVLGNLIGSDITGTLAVPNGYGIFFAQAGGDTVGGTASGAGNVISGNASDGIYLGRAGSTGIVIEGNLIGTDVGGTKSLPNDIGVLVNLGAHNNTIGGTTSGAGNVISGNTADGVEISDGNTSGNLVSGNEIGADLTGTIAISNGTGVEIDTGATGNTIGGTAAGSANIISGNDGSSFSTGVEITGGGTSGNLVAGNMIGTDSTGTAALPNTNGVSIEGGASGNTIGGTVAGAGNTIAFNTGDAVEVVTGIGNAILENVVYANGSGIVLASGGNDDQIAPVITAVTTEPAMAPSAEVTISVDLTAAGFAPGSTYSLDFFASSSFDPAGEVEAHFYLGTQTFTGGMTGIVTFTSSSLPLFASQTVTATATLLAGSTFTDTSAFSTPATMVNEFSDFVVTTTAATGAGSLEQAILSANADTTDPSRLRDHVRDRDGERSLRHQPSSGGALSDYSRRGPLRGKPTGLRRLADHRAGWDRGHHERAGPRQWVRRQRDPGFRHHRLHRGRHGRD